MIQYELFVKKIINKKALATLKVGQKRLAWIDVAKGWCILLVILGHHHLLADYRVYFYSFHLPIFFFVSGYLFRPYASSRIFWRKKFMSLIGTYFLLGIPQLIFYFLYTVGWQNTTGTLIWQKVSDFFIQKKFWSLWFLLCLFFVNMTFYYLRRWCKNSLSLSLSVVLLTAIGLTYYQLGGQTLPWNFDSSLTALPFFYFGFVCHHYHWPAESRRKISSWGWLLFLTIVNVAAVYFSVKITGQCLEMFYDHYGYPPLTYTAACAGVIVVIIISQFFPFRFLRFVGRHSLIFFAIHQKVMMPLVESFLRQFAVLGERKSLPFQLCEYILVIASLSVICWLWDWYCTYRQQKMTAAASCQHNE